MANLLMLGEIATILYIGGIAKAATMVGFSALLFPELAALSYDVLTRPHGTWAQAPFKLVVTPTLTAIIGALLEHTLQYGYLSVLSCIAASLLIIRLLKSPIAPAISAGLLPIVIGEESWWYPFAVFFGVVTLTALLAIFRKFISTSKEIGAASADDIFDEVVEQLPRQYKWIPFFLIFLIGGMWMVDLTGVRFILFPPLVVIAYEMFSHPARCSWASRPFALITACTVTAFAGTGFHTWVGNGSIAAILSVVTGIFACRFLRLHIPPALAIALLPFVMSQPGYWFALAVGSGTFILTLVFMSYRYIFEKSLLVSSVRLSEKL